MNRVLQLAAGAAFAVALGAQAQVYKCPGPGGKLTYQSEPCEGGKALPGDPARPPAAAPGAEGGSSGEREVALMHSMKCLQMSDTLYGGVMRSGATARTREEVHFLEEFRRDCQGLGFQVPQTRGIHQDNQVRHARRVEALLEEEKRAFEAERRRLEKARAERYRRPKSATP